MHYNVHLAVQGNMMGHDVLVLCITMYVCIIMHTWLPRQFNNFREYGIQCIHYYLQGIVCSCVNITLMLMLFTDLANPKGNLKTAGFTVEERESFSTLLEENKLTDSFRHLYPEKKDTYSYWSYRFNARKNNKGW